MKRATVLGLPHLLIALMLGSLVLPITSVADEADLPGDFRTS